MVTIIPAIETLEKTNRYTNFFSNPSLIREISCHSLLTIGEAALTQRATTGNGTARLTFAVLRFLRDYLNSTIISFTLLQIKCVYPNEPFSQMLIIFKTSGTLAGLQPLQISGSWCCVMRCDVSVRRLVYTSRFSTGRQVPIIAGQNIGTQGKHRPIHTK
jgi:hypothetical protein